MLARVEGDRTRPPDPDLAPRLPLRHVDLYPTLLALLGRALREAGGDAVVPDEPPPDAVALAKAAWNDAELEAELAALLFDSAQDEALEPMRAGEPGASRALAYRGSAARIEIEIGEDGILLGQLEPAGSADVTVEGVETAGTATADALGRFRCSAPPGRLRLHVRWPDGSELRTPWISR